ncbi:MAG TPA: NAD(P)H-dependent oxidoreductase subunit E, partial [Clostridiales bacterium]|nr:NAD(P)H-dependent oxidoreductase subunit E [Clostridiales bacterium]
KFTMQDTRCLGCCGLAPVLVINDHVYGRLVTADVKGILEKYK